MAAKRSDEVTTTEVEPKIDSKMAPWSMFVPVMSRKLHREEEGGCGHFHRSLIRQVCPCCMQDYQKRGHVL